MKPTLVLILAGFLVFGPGNAGIAQDQKTAKKEQEVAKKEQKAEMKAQKEEVAKREKEIKARKEYIEQERKAAMAEHERAMAEHLEHLEDIQIDMGDFYMKFDELDLPASYIAGDDFFVYGPGGQQNQTQLTLRNQFRGGSDSSNGTFDVEEGARRFKCLISGKVRSGEIKIKILYPDGKVFKDMTINSSAEITFSQSVNISEKEPDKYMGSWKYEIQATKAEGNYMVQVSTQ